MRFLGQGSDPSHSCDLHHSGGNTGSLTHCARLGVKPAYQPFFCTTVRTPKFKFLNTISENLCMESLIIYRNFYFTPYPNGPHVIVTSNYLNLLVCALLACISFSFCSFLPGGLTFASPCVHLLNSLCPSSSTASSSLWNPLPYSHTPLPQY